jgi:hypothetical protein
MGVCPSEWWVVLQDSKNQDQIEDGRLKIGDCERIAEGRNPAEEKNEIPGDPPTICGSSSQSRGASVSPLAPRGIEPGFPAA